MVSVVVRHHVVWICCLTALLFAVMGCRREPTPSPKTAEPISRTEFTEHIENFFEYEPLMPARPSAFHIHLTDLSDGAPVEKADVTLSVRPERAERGVDTRAEVGRVPGTYGAQVTVPAPGRYTIEFRIKTAKLDERMVLDRFMSGDSSAPISVGDESGTVKFLMEQQWAIRMKLATPLSVTAARQITATGRVTPAPGRHVGIAPPVSGILTGDTLPRVGQSIIRGDTVAIVRQTPTAAESAQIAAVQAQAHVEMVRLETERRRLEESINEARVRRDHAKAELERAQALYSAGAIAQRQLETTDAAYRIAESSLATIIAQRDAVAGARIPDLSPSATIATSVMTAPISGTVVRVSKSDGERVAAGDVILEILDPSVVWIEVPIFERDLPRLGNSAGGLVTTPATPGKEFRGRLVDAGAMVNRETRAATMVLEVPNPDRALRVGVQANVRLDADERASVVMIPREAVLESEGKHFVYVLVSGQHFQRREVVVGDEYGEKLAITGGLKPEERVVTQGAYQLHQHQLRPSAPGAHTHET